MVVFKKSEFERDANDIIQLCGTWWNDSLFYKTYKMQYRVYADFFFRLKDAGFLIYTCGRNEKGELVSCYVGSKSPYMFNPLFMVATEIVWCVRKEDRNFKNLIGLTNAIEDLMKEESIDVWSLAVSNEEQYDSTGAFLCKKEYTLMDKIYSKSKIKGG